MLKIISLLLLANVAMAGSATLNAMLTFGNPISPTQPTVLLPLNSNIPTDLNNWIILTSGGQGNQSKFLRWSKVGTSTNNYIVTTGKTLICPIMVYRNDTAQQIAFGYSTNDPSNSASVPTGNVPYSNGTTTTVANMLTNSNWYASTSATWTTIEADLTFPSNKYPWFIYASSSGNIGIELQCWEQ